MVLTLVTVMTAGPAIYLMVHYDYGDARFPSDYPGHLHLIQQAIQDGSWQPHFLMQWMVYLAAGLRPDYEPLGWAMLAISLACLSAKACLTYGLYGRYLTGSDGFGARAAALGVSSETLACLLALGSVTLMPILDPSNVGSIYLGQIAPNIWHNPTSLLVWPLAILLFLAAHDFLERPDDRPVRRLAWIGVLAVLNLIAKPNFVMAFGPAFVLACAVRMRSPRMILRSAVSLAPALGVLLWQQHWTYAHTTAVPAIATSVTLAPLAAWRMHSTSPLLSTLRSVAFPLAYLVLFGRRLRHPGLVGLAWATFMVALAWAVLFAETGERMWHFNFIWGAHIALYPLFAVSIVDFLGRPTAGARWTATVLWVLLGLHLFSGLVYFYRQSIGLGYA